MNGPEVLGQAGSRWVAGGPPPGGYVAGPYLTRLWWWRQRLLAPGLRTWVLWWPLCFITSIMAISTWDVRTFGPTDDNQVTSLALLLWMAGLATAAALHWRRRFPLAVVLGTSVVPLLLPLDPTAALIAFASMTVRRLSRLSLVLAALVMASTTVSAWRDIQGQSARASFWQLLAGREPDTSGALAPLPTWTAVAIGVVLVAVALGAAMIVRDQTSIRSRLAAEVAHRQVVDQLSGELARTTERDRIAQEVHDALGHRLSLLSLHAGALELAAGDNPRAAQSAALVRANAEQAMTDLRGLLTMLRGPGTQDVVSAVPTLQDLPALIEETAQTDVRLISTLELQGLETLHATTSRSTYRIAQELLTNARRHAPGIGIRVRVVASPESGVEIEVANHLPHHASAGFNPGSGMRGIEARVAQLGGQWRCWVDEFHVFRSAVHVPWIPDTSAHRGRR